MRQSSLKILAALCLGIAVSAGAADGVKIGIVLLHGKEGSPNDRVISSLASALRGAGYPVATPLMPWAGSRIYDASYQDAMNEIDREVAALKQQGASRIVIAGQSIGANAAIGYAALRDTPDAIIALAPGHTPELPRVRALQAGEVRRAQELVSAGKSSERERFQDTNVGKPFHVSAAPGVFLSYWNPEGPAVIPKNAAAIKRSLPVLVVVGSRDPLTRPTEYFFDKLPANPKSRYLSVEGGHLQVPDAARREVLDWLKTLD